MDTDEVRANAAWLDREPFRTCTDTDRRDEPFDPAAMFDTLADWLERCHAYAGDRT